MWFQVLALVIATALVVKAVVALAIPHRFYAARRQQYASTSLPVALMVPPAIIFVIAALGALVYAP